VNPLTNLTPRDRAAFIYKAATLVAQLLPFTEAIESDAFTSDERDRFRELASKAGVFALAESLRPLCSNEAHALNRARAAGIALAVINTRTGGTTTMTFPNVRSIRTTNRRKK
jgi:hypothetical protein